MTECLWSALYFVFLIYHHFYFIGFLKGYIGIDTGPEDQETKGLRVFWWYIHFTAIGLCETKYVNEPLQKHI